MQSLRLLRPRRWLGVCLGTALAGRLIAQAPPDSSAEASLSDYQTACQADAGRLWGQSLCGPLILVDPATRAAIANEQPPGGKFELAGGLWRGSLPPGIPTSNFALTWVGRRWSMVLLPLPPDRYDRLALLVHESFHRIQPALGLSGTDPLNPHLDEREGRYWLRLELRALAAALEATGNVRDRAVTDALLFRHQRQSRYPGADTLEAQLERQEGLAEYTGARIAIDALGLTSARAAVPTRQFESRPSYVRALGYGTGPGLGLLLDHYAPAWRKRAGQVGLAALLAEARRFRPPRDLVVAARTAAGRYDGAALAALEDERAAQRAVRLADYREIGRAHV